MWSTIGGGGLWLEKTLVAAVITAWEGSTRSRASPEMSVSPTRSPAPSETTARMVSDCAAARSSISPPMENPMAPTRSASTSGRSRR